MTSSQRQNLDYFINKIVTFLTPPISRQLHDKDVLNYVMGKVVKLDEIGIWFQDIQTGCLNFIFYDKIITIAEEKLVINEDKTEKKDTQVDPVAKSSPANSKVNISFQDIKNAIKL